MASLQFKKSMVVCVSPQVVSNIQEEALIFEKETELLKRSNIPMRWIEVRAMILRERVRGDIYVSRKSRNLSLEMVQNCE